MKQPQLGKKISELRKAKGLTQEELVEKCNLNVRTIQRIESGEVTPRSYTVKALFEALGVEEGNFVVEQSPEFPKGARKWLILSFVSGIIYFILGFLELPMDIKMLTGSGDPVNWNQDYTVIKLLVLGTFTMYLMGFLQISKHEKNQALTIATWALLLGNLFWVVLDIYLAHSGSFSHSLYSITKLGTVGLLYIVFGFGFLKFESPWKSYFGALGVLGMLTGVLFLTVAGAVGALFTLTIFDIGLLICLMTYIRKIGRSTSPDSTFSAELQS